MTPYEVEIKSLLGDKNKADAFRGKLTSENKTKLTSTSKQLNHYFIGGNLLLLSQIAGRFLPSGKADEFTKIAKKTKSFSVRTRQKDDDIIFVIKASVDNTTSENGIARVEFEEKVNLPLETLDSLIREAGFDYQAKWSREREEYSYGDINICLDKNAGYGWLVEFEKIIEAEEDILRAKEQLRALMKQLFVEELSQDRLQRMFDYYNKHWMAYYGTDKTFTIE